MCATPTARLVTVICLCLVAGAALAADEVYRSPADVAYSPDGATLAVADPTAGELVLLSADDGKVLASVAGLAEPAAVAWSADGKAVYVSEHGSATVAVVDVIARKVRSRIEVGRYPLGLTLSPGHNRLVVCNWGSNSLSLIDLAAGKAIAEVPVLREPFSVAVTPDGGVAIVSNLLPVGPATDPQHAACVSVVQLESMRRVADIQLPPGSGAVRGVAVSGDGAWGYAVHTLGRTHLPTTQLERGWVNTNALSVIDLKSRAVYATVLLDHPMQGAADPWGLVISPDGKRLFVSLSGIHQLAVIDLEKLPTLFGDRREGLVNDLSALYRTSLIRRETLPGHGPRGIAVSPDGKSVAAAVYFTGTVARFDVEANGVAWSAPVGAQPEPSVARLGERVFFDAQFCFQNWLSCATCHPGARVDGFNWDLLNDGLGNPKNTRSMLWSDRTPPVMSLGVRENMDAAVAAGFRHIQFRVVDDQTLDAVRTYLRTLGPMPSPHLDTNGKLTAAARRGQQVFMSMETGCATCHPAPLLTDLKTHDVGTRGELDRVDSFDTPTLVELWRSAPFLHDGSAATLRDVLIDLNKGDRHGRTSQLSEQEVNDLIEYLNSLCATALAGPAAPPRAAPAASPRPGRGSPARRGTPRPTAPR